MLVLLLVFGIEAIAQTLGLMASPWVLSALTHLNDASAFLFKPVVALAWLAAPPLVAAARGRRWWVWLLGSIALGPFALAVACLPRSPAPAALEASGG